MFGINEKRVGGWVMQNIMGLIWNAWSTEVFGFSASCFLCFLDDTLAEALMLQNKNDSSRGPLLSLSLCREHHRAGVEF